MAVVRFLARLYYAQMRQLLLALAFMTSASVAQADSIMFMDEAGNIHFAERLVDVPPQYRNQLRKAPTPVPDPQALRKLEQQRKMEEKKVEMERKKHEQEEKKRKLLEDKEREKEEKRQQLELKRNAGKPKR